MKAMNSNTLLKTIGINAGYGGYPGIMGCEF